ncbi:protein kinase [Cytobacillus suaedae]|nr:protein kinase [Cytobacillus suaedae]
MFEQIIDNWKDYCTEANVIGIGSTRKVYKIDDYVIKKHLHPLGYKQSLKEVEIFNCMLHKGWSEIFAEVYYADEFIAIQKYYKTLDLRNNQSFDIDVRSDSNLIPYKFEDILSFLDKEFDSFDLKDSGNYGLNNENKLVFIDYGMTKASMKMSGCN